MLASLFNRAAEKNFHSAMVLGKSIDIFKKNAKYLTFGPFLNKSEFSTKIGLHHSLASIVPNFKQKIKKNKPILRKILNGRADGRTDAQN